VVVRGWRSQLFPQSNEVLANQCVQRRLACSVRDSPTEVTVGSFVAWIAGRKETEFLQPIDKAIPGMVSKSSGRNESERIGGLESEGPEAKPSHVGAKAAWSAAD
jgi:hypothetical protein